MPPTRTAPRVAVLGSTAQRPVTSSYHSRKGNALRRRVVVAALALTSLALITVYFRESDSGPLHGAQGAGAAVLRPFEVAATRVVRPFRDAYNWFDDLRTAKAENARLRAELLKAQQQAALGATSALDLERLKKLLRVNDLPSYAHGYNVIPARVLTAPPSDYEQEITIMAGSNAGVRQFAPVATVDGLVGYVSEVTKRVSKVTLVTDPQNAVAALDPKTRAWGMVQRGQGGTDSLVMNRVTKDETVYRTDRIVTFGSGGTHELPSIYPQGIPIGQVVSVGQTDVDLYKEIQLRPFAHVTAGDFVSVLISKKPLPEIP